MFNKTVSFSVTIVLVGVLALTACSGSPQESYVGVWNAEGDDPKTIEITKVGDGYLFQDLRSTSKNNSPQPLTIQESQLSFQMMPLALSDDKNTLFFANASLARVPSSDGQSLKQEITDAITQCRKLDEDYNNEKKVKPVREWEDLTRDYAERAQKIPNCFQSADLGFSMLYLKYKN